MDEKKETKNLYCIRRWATTLKLSLYSSIEKTSVGFCWIREWGITDNKLSINRH